MNLNYAHQTPVGKITIAVFLIVAAATRDAVVGLLLFMGLCLSLLMLTPVVALIRWACLRCHLQPLPRRILMLAPIMGFCGFVFSRTNDFGGSQRSCLEHGLGGRLPRHTRLAAYDGRSGMFGEYYEMSILCDPLSFRQILEAAPFVKLMEEDRMEGMKSEAAQFTKKQRSTEWIVYRRENEDPSAGGVKCTIVTDPSYAWAYVSYSAGS